MVEQAFKTDRNFRSPAEHFRWFLEICRRDVNTNGTIAVFKNGDDHQLIRQAFVEVGDEYSEDICAKALALKRAAEAYLVEVRVGDIEVVIRDIETNQGGNRQPDVYKQVAFLKIKKCE